jgi:hypothetical protein
VVYRQRDTRCRESSNRIRADHEATVMPANDLAESPGGLFVHLGEV